MKDLFPYEKVRDQQNQLVEAVKNAVNLGGQLVVHAPTGLGKTAASLAPTIAYAMEHKKTVLFLTSRITQHSLALKTVKEINEKHDAGVRAADIIGKRHYCLQPGADRLRSKEFMEYCKALREDKACEYYENFKQGEELTAKSKLAMKELGAAHSSEAIKNTCSGHKVCPYEIAIQLAKKAHVIITDYNYVFNPGVSQSFLQKIDKEISDLIIVVDEAHNLPDRVKESASDKLTSIMLQRAANEAEKFHYEEHAKTMKNINDLFSRLGLTIEEHMEERYIDKEDVTKRIDDIKLLIENLDSAGDAIREEQQFSYLGAVADFLRTWCSDEEDGFTRIFSEYDFNGETIYTLSYRCLDPSVVTGEILNNAHASIMMSGTLSPTRMYKELFGVLRAKELTLSSPFLESNRLSLIIPRTSTKYTSRSEAMYAEIAAHCTKAANSIPGNVAIFLPSYALLSSVQKHFGRLKKTVFTERPKMTSQEKEEMINKFKEYKEQGAVLLGVISGNFGEGIDLPGDLLKGVIVVGLPLGKPTLETKALIRYFDNKFGRGWEYGYTFPAFNKTLQSAGRCIRTENDRGVIIFLDERYEHDRYKSCFPEDWDLKTTILYDKLIEGFFDGSRS